MQKKSPMENKIVLFAKQAGKTSFSSLFTIKHALKTKKVGHTGTLDSFAEGLLVVCTGNLTKLSGRITSFDKTYKAVIVFGEETDTLECTGNVIKKTPLPTKENVINAVNYFTKTYMQTPPSFSAIHIDGRRASDEARKGKILEIPKREVTVFSSQIEDFLIECDDFVKAILVSFHVSKGTYIRSLARDIAEMSGSCAHLASLLRVQVGHFRLEDAAGFSLLNDFTIENSFYLAKNLRKAESEVKIKDKNYMMTEEEENLQEEVRKKSLSMNEELAVSLGFGILHLVQGSEKMFLNGAKLSSSMFTSSPFELDEHFAAVFNEQGIFCGLLEKNESGYFRYSFVVSD